MTDQERESEVDDTTDPIVIRLSLNKTSAEMMLVILEDCDDSDHSWIIGGDGSQILDFIIRQLKQAVGK